MRGGGFCKVEDFCLEMQSAISVRGPHQGKIVPWSNRHGHVIFWSIKNQPRQCMKTEGILDRLYRNVSGGKGIEKS